MQLFLVLPDGKEVPFSVSAGTGPRELTEYAHELVGSVRPGVAVTLLVGDDELDDASWTGLSDGDCVIVTPSRVSGTGRWRVSAVERVTSWAWDVYHIGFFARRCVCPATLDSVSGDAGSRVYAASNALSERSNNFWGARPDEGGKIWMVLRLPPDAAPTSLHLSQTDGHYARHVSVEREIGAGEWVRVALAEVRPGGQVLALDSS